MERSLKGACVVAVAILAAGCSITMPFDRAPSSALASDAEITTGSIAPRPPKDTALPPGQVSPFSPKLDEEDWRRARAAMGTALDPQGNGGNVRWENSDSGYSGSFAPVGNPFLIKDDICRNFVAMVSLKEPDQWFQGNACRINSSEWAIKDMTPWKKPG
jgi:surface antigen